MTSTSRFVTIFGITSLFFCVIRFSYIESYKYEFWDTYPIRDGNYKASLFLARGSVTRLADAAELYAFEDISTSQGVLNFALRIKENSSLCSVRINQHTSPFFSLPQLITDSKKPFKNIPVELASVDMKTGRFDMLDPEYVSGKLPEAGSRLLLLKTQDNVSDSSYCLVLLLEKK